MTVQEKKAIELLRYNRLEDFDIQYEKALKIIYDLIETQQKEIEELMQRNNSLTKALEEWINGERINDIKHISKDKIREKIKELKYMSLSNEIYFDDVLDLFNQLLED